MIPVSEVFHFLSAVAFPSPTPPDPGGPFLLLHKKEKNKCSREAAGSRKWRTSRDSETLRGFKEHRRSKHLLLARYRFAVRACVWVCVALSLSNSCVWECGAPCPSLHCLATALELGAPCLCLCVCVFSENKSCINHNINKTSQAIFIFLSCERRSSRSTG